jgi:heme/copper-type cytochrome/quinol oxidase subunit 3
MSQLALPAAGHDRPKNLVNLAMILLGAASFLFFVTLFAVYFDARALAKTWPPKGVKIDNYPGTMLVVTLVMSAFTAEWAEFALRKGNRSQSLVAMVMTVVFGLASLNLVWYVGNRLGFGPGTHPYGTMFWALLIAMGVHIVIGLVVLAVVLSRTLAHQVDARDPELARAGTWYWHFVVVSSTLAFFALYVFQHK